VHADCVAAVEDAVKLCADLGHIVAEARPKIDGEQVVLSFTTVWTSGLASTLKMIGAQKEQVERTTWAVNEIGSQYSAADYILALQTIQTLSRDVARFFEDYDVLLTPTLAEPPLPLGAFDSPADNPLKGFQRAAEFIPFTPICNITGQPAMSVPLLWNSENLPVGAHFIGRFGDEATLFRLAAQLEKARPWADRRPPVSA
jgi:amidase